SPAAAGAAATDVGAARRGAGGEARRIAADVPDPPPGVDDLVDRLRVDLVLAVCREADLDPWLIDAVADGAVGA
ncbi:MAG: hypothetical protein ACK5PP_18100, partial [Acidimicrobiales bacterium]